jgi:hypothetical protein
MPQAGFGASLVRGRTPRGVLSRRSNPRLRGPKFRAVIKKNGSKERRPLSSRSRFAGSVFWSDLVEPSLGSEG